MFEQNIYKKMEAVKRLRQDLGKSPQLEPLNTNALFDYQV